MNHPTSAKNVSGQSGRSWQTRTPTSQHATSRSLTTSPGSTRRMLLEEESKGKEKERETTHLAEIRHKPWLRASEDFTSAPELGRPKEGNSPVIHFFRKQATGSVWIAKLGEVPLRNEVLINAALQSSSFLGVYADEILEKLALALYQLLGTQTPTTALSYQPVTKEGMHTDFLLHMQLDAKEQGRLFELPPSPRMHFMSKFIKDFRRLDEDFLELYPVLAKQCGNEHVQILTSEGEYMPLKGLGSMLAAADFLYDCDCLGNSCGNAGYVIREDRARGERYAQLVKIDAGYAFSYSELRFDKEHNPRDRTVAVAPNKLRLQFADLAPADQKEFAATAKRILATPYEEFATSFPRPKS